MQSGRVVSSNAIVESRRGEFLISTDRSRLDLDVIHGFLTNCYWAKGIPREVVARSIEHSLCFGVYDGSGAQVGFARVVSDFATMAYVGDVFVLDIAPRSRAGQVADGVDYAASRAAEFAALDSYYARRARAIFASWIYSGEISRALYGTAPARRLRDQENDMKNSASENVPSTLRRAIRRLRLPSTTKLAASTRAWN